jgi:hypothetical protein
VGWVKKGGREAGTHLICCHPALLIIAPTPPVIITIIAMAIVIVVVVVVDGWMDVDGWGLFVWVMQPLQSLIGTYLPILHAILAHMAQWLSAYLIVVAIVTTRGCVFESVKKQMLFFAPH